MSFFYSESRSKLPLRGRKKLPLRGKRGRRLALLRDFKVGQVYTFCSFSELEDLPEDCITLWEVDDRPGEVRL